VKEHGFYVGADLTYLLIIPNMYVWSWSGD
jgi:hypothetical protein